MASRKYINGVPNDQVPSQRPTILLHTAELSKSPYMDALKTLLDNVFDWAHVSAVPGKEFLPDKMGRLQSGPQQLVSEIGPDGFCIIMFESEIGGKVIATASAKPYKPTKAGESHGSEVNMMFKRAPGKDPMDADVVGNDVENQARWELLAFATDVSLMGQGIAGRLTDLTYAEIRRQAAAKGKGKIVLMLSTMQEVNEPYYLKRGFQTMNITKFSSGTQGSRDGFSVAEMVKVLA